MSKSTHHKLYIVRGFDINAAPFTSFGEMASQASFVEKVVDKQHDAVAVLLADQSIGTMAANKIRPLIGNSTAPMIVTELTAINPDLVPEIIVIDVKIVTNAGNASDLRPFRSEIREILKRWAEKSRIPGVRGWRANAIKTPTFEHDSSSGGIVIRTQAVLGTAVFYNQNRATVGTPVDFQQAIADLGNLKQHVEDCLGHLYRTFYYTHSQFGKGEVQ